MLVRHPRRDGSVVVLPQMREPSFCLGLERPSLRLVTPRGHSLLVGPPDAPGTRVLMDASPRTLLVVRHSVVRPGGYAEHQACLEHELSALLPMFRRVVLLVR